MTDRGSDPSWDPRVRARVHAELARLLATMRRLVEANDDNGVFWERDPVGIGDLSGLTRSAEVSLIEPLEAQLASARAVIAEARAQAGAYARDRYDPGRQPGAGQR